MNEHKLPLVAIVGRPNVGKSTLYNRIVGGRPALVEDRPGVTRDRRYGETEWNNRRFALVDTGGLDPTAEKGVITAGIHRQAAVALEEADLIVFVIDAREGVTGIDKDVARQIRKLGKPVIVAANKVDGEAQEFMAADGYQLGLGDVVSVSASHGRGANDLLDQIMARLPDAPEVDVLEERPDDRRLIDESIIRLAFVGKPNAGKSSLVNRILGEERVLVHDQPGTTTDPVDTPFTYEGKDFVLVDTAGIRKKARVKESELTEQVSVSMALDQLHRAGVVALVIDGAAEGPTDQDAKIAGHIEQSGRGVMILVNKTDALGSGPELAAAEKKLREQLEDTIPFLSFAPIRFVSARTGAGVAAALALAAKIHEENRRHVSTPELNKFFDEVCETHPPPTFRSKPARIYYITQPLTQPPTFVVWANKAELIHHAYRRFLANQLRERFGFEGSPIKIIVRERKKK